jgi:hypothetical protein
MVNEGALVLPLFQMFLADLCPQVLQKLPIIIVVNRLAWRNIFLINALIAKKGS